MNAYLDTVESPAGPLTFAVDGMGALVMARFAEGAYERPVELEAEGYTLLEDREKTARAREELQEYAAGELRSFDLPLAPAGSEWQRAVWATLRRIPFGETRTYSEVAALAGRPGAARAAGRANAANRLPLVVPCHRVIGADGSLAGFAGGVRLKVRLLEHEARVLDRASRRSG
jgi:methylated-DNA-[protein]-cysteine S-methyltransferase